MRLVNTNNVYKYLLPIPFSCRAFTLFTIIFVVEGAFFHRENTAEDQQYLEHFALHQ